MNNTEIAEKLRAIAGDLWRERRNLYRVKAYRRAAEMLQRLDRPVEELFHEQGRTGLMRIPGIGRGLSRTIAGYLADREACVANRPHPLSSAGANPSPPVHREQRSMATRTRV